MLIMTYRGYDPYLVSRVSRAGSHYLDPDTLRFFDAYMGPIWRGESFDVIVESVRPSWGPRVYKVAVFAYNADGTATTLSTDPDRAWATSKSAAKRASAAWAALKSGASLKSVATLIGDGIAAYLTED